jgi:hypothetical protein
MPKQHDIYFESQRNGLCRLHVLNAFFGFEKISETQFNLYISEYDQDYMKKYNISSCKSFDIISSDQKNIVSYILKKHSIYTRYFACNQLHGINIKSIIDTSVGEFFFAYTESHIYGFRKKNNKWYIVDSIGGVRLMNIDAINQKNMGYIFIVDIKKEFYRNLKIIKKILDDTSSPEEIKNYLVQKNSEKKILGELEIPLGICMDILETQLFNQTRDFNPITTQVKSYNEFICQFTNGKYNDIELILKYLPDILYNLTQLSIVETPIIA